MSSTTTMFLQKPFSRRYTGMELIPQLEKSSGKASQRAVLQSPAYLCEIDSTKVNKWVGVKWAMVESLYVCPVVHRFKISQPIFSN
mmetsp:Transcript_4303/g.6636  ORF Transcript_4303/g.6636 Transcript_4303/m.6636 type:complete len:86 (-) Transcript_4303:33-290(-)